MPHSTGLDPALLARARAALDAHLAADGPVGTGGGLTGHRGWMRAVKAAVVVSLAGDGVAHDGVAALRWLLHLESLQSPSGLFSSGDNLASPPDSSFTLTDVGQVLALLRGAGRAARREEAPAWTAEVAERLAGVLRRAIPAVVSGGVHTPNHRWEIAGALARAGDLLGDDEGAAALARAREWLTEGIDVDADGVYSERSANYAAHVSNPSLLVLAEVLDAPELRAIVHANLHTLLDLATPDGRTETVLSRRQDQKSGPFPLGPFLAQYAGFATGCERCRAATHWCASLPGVDAVDVVAHAMLDPRVRAGLAAGLAAGSTAPTVLAAAALGAGERLLVGPRLWRRRDAEGWTVAYAGSDVPAMGRVASGLACNPTFLRLARGGIEVASVRLSRDFFGLGPFRPTQLHVDGDRVVLTEEVAAGYYQPLPAADRSPDGSYALEFEGRFAAAMAFSRRTVDELRLRTEVILAVGLEGVDLEIRTDGPATAHVLELAFGEGVTLDGVAPLGGGAHRLVGRDALARRGNATLAITCEPASDDAVPAGYSPGEAYEFLGGTDAVGGERVAIAWTSPGVQRVTIRSAGATPS